MEVQKKISVLSAGNPSGEGGVGLLTMYNNPQFDVENDTHGGLGMNAYYFTIQIKPSYTVYKIIINNVRSSGAVRGAYLAIAFSIPKGYRLAGLSPYDALMELWDKFRNKCMNLKDKSMGIYEFATTVVDPHVLDETAASFTLEPTATRYGRMNPAGPKALLVLPEDKIKKLMSDVNYDEFAEFSEIIIAEGASSDSVFKRIGPLEIPRRREFKLIVDGIENGTYSDLDQLITVKGGKNPRYYDLVTESFTIRDLLENSTSVEGVKLDENKEEIQVNTSEWAMPKRRRIRLNFNLKDAENYFRANPDFIEVKRGNGTPYQVNDLSFVVVGEAYRELEEDLIKVNTKAKSRLVTDSMDADGNPLKNYKVDGDILTVIVKEKEPELPPYQVGSDYARQGSYQGSGKKSGGNQVGRSTDKNGYGVESSTLQEYLAVTLSFRELPVESPIRICLKESDDEQSKVAWMQSVDLQRITVAKFNTGNTPAVSMQARFLIPRSLTDCYLSFRFGNKRYFSMGALSVYVRNGKEAELSDREFRSAPIPSGKNDQTYIYIGVACAVLIIGMVIGYFLYNPVSKLFGKEPPVTETKYEGKKGDSGSNGWDEFDAKLRKDAGTPGDTEGEPGAVDNGSGEGAGIDGAGAVTGEVTPEVAVEEGGATVKPDPKNTGALGVRAGGDKGGKSGKGTTEKKVKTENKGEGGTTTDKTEEER